MLDGTIDRTLPDALYLRGAQFHEAVMAGAGNPFTLQALMRVNRVRRLLTHRAMDDRERYSLQSREHLAILDLIEAGDHHRAVLQMEAHLRTVRHSLSALGFIAAQDVAGPPPD